MIDFDSESDFDPDKSIDPPLFAMLPCFGNAIRAVRTVLPISFDLLGGFR